MWKQGDLVKPNPQHTRVVNKEMQEWLENNKDRIYKVERIYEESVKLYKIDFWISADLLVE